MYSLEYEMMLQVLRQLRSSGKFHADIPSQTALREGGQVVLFAQSGNVISCFIFNKNGLMLYHDAEAQRLLPRLGTLSWKLVSSSENRHTTQPLQNTSPIPSIAAPNAKSAERNGDFILQRLPVPEGQIRAWSTLERSVYSLADGTRSIEQIAMLLSRPIQTIEQVIHHFEVAGVIKWRAC